MEDQINELKKKTKTFLFFTFSPFPRNAQICNATHFVVSGHICMMTMIMVMTKPSALSIACLSLKHPSCKRTLERKLPGINIESLPGMRTLDMEHFDIILPYRNICLQLNTHVFKAYLLSQKYGLYMLVLLASPRWRWSLQEYLLASYRI